MIALYHFLMSISHQAKQNYNGQKKFQSAEGFKPLLIHIGKNHKKYISLFYNP